MIDINLNGALPTHVDRIKPKISVDSAGKINWTPGYLDYNASNYFPGKTVKSEEFNKHNLQHVYQGNYLMDVLQSVFDTHLPDSMNKLFRSTFGIKNSVVKTFTSLDWGEQQEDGYYYIDIPVSEHKFEPDETKENTLERMNIDTEMYLLNSDGRFYEVQQVTIDTDNTVHIYTDDPTLAGFVVIRTNDKAIAVAQANFHISQVLGKAEVAETGKYTDLVDLTRPDGTGPDDRITANARDIASILSGVDNDNNIVKVAKALQADSANEASAMLGTGTLGGRVIDNIFEVGSNTVKKATNADNAALATNAVSANYAVNAAAVNNIKFGFSDNYPYVSLGDKGMYIPTRTAAWEPYDETGDFIKLKVKRKPSAGYIHGELWFSFCFGETGIGDESKFCECITKFSIGVPNATYPVACPPIYNLRFYDAIGSRYIAPYLVYEKIDENDYMYFKLYTDKVLGDSGVIDISNKTDVYIDSAAIEVIYSELF